MARQVRNAQTAVASAMGGCYDCHGNEARWTHRGAIGTASRHAAATGHHTWAEQVVTVRYNKPEGDADPKLLLPLDEA